MNTKDYPCQFGFVDAETGTPLESFLDENGKMSCKPLKWWQKLFRGKPEKKEFLCVHAYRSRFPWSKEWTHHEVAMYKYFNPYTNEIYKIEGSDDRETIQYDIGAFLKGFIVVNRK